MTSNIQAESTPTGRKRGRYVSKAWPRSDAQQLSARLEEVERNVNFILSTVLPKLDHLYPLTAQSSSPSASSAPPTSQYAESVPENQQLRQVQLPTFSGETSIRHIIKEVTENLDAVATQYGNNCASSSSSIPADMDKPSSPSTQDRLDTKTESGGNDIRKILLRHDIDLHMLPLEDFMALFSHEVHILYPFLHLPTLWENFWKFYETCYWVPPPSSRQVLSRYKAAQILLCLAIGLCTGLPRVDSRNRNRKHDAGWSLYTAAMELLGDVFDCFNRGSNPILVLQTLALAVIYLYRLDITGKAEKLLALAISHAHHLGLHRSQPVNDRTISNHDIEMCRRLWWSLYLLDRRIAIDTGRPFVIQDINVDTPLPRRLDDDCVNASNATGETEKTLDKPSPIPFFGAMVTYSRLLGKVWEAMYSASGTRGALSHPLRENLEQMLFAAQREVPAGFSYESNEQILPMPPTPSSPQWPIKQRVLMQIRWLSLHLLIRKPLLRNESSPVLDLAAQHNYLVCVHLSISIIRRFSETVYQIGATFTFTYAFLHYLITATIMSLGLIIKERSLEAAYGGTTLHGVVIIETYCRKTWVSGKLIRTVSRLGEIAKKGNSTHPLQTSGNYISNQGHPSVHGVSDDSGPRSRVDAKDGVAGDMGWLEALFGDYLDSNLIIPSRPEINGVKQVVNPQSHAPCSLRKHASGNNTRSGDNNGSFP
ncbi:fungal-specific transcription factor domain-containing protein [Aspergillus spectabilis]